MYSSSSCCSCNRSAKCKTLKRAVQVRVHQNPSSSIVRLQVHAVQYIRTLASVSQHVMTSDFIPVVSQLNAVNTTKPANEKAFRI